MKRIKILLGALAPNAGRRDGKIQFLKNRENAGDEGATLYDRYHAIVLGDDGTPLLTVAGKPQNGFVSLNSNTVAAVAGQPVFLVGTEIFVEEQDFQRSVEASARNTTFPTWMLVFTSFAADMSEEIIDYKLKVDTAVAIAEAQATKVARAAWQKKLRMQILTGQRQPLNIAATSPATATEGDATKAKEGGVTDGGTSSLAGENTAGLAKKALEITQAAQNENPANAGADNLGGAQALAGAVAEGDEA